MDSPGEDERPRNSYLYGEFEQVQISYAPWLPLAAGMEVGHPRLYHTLTDREQIAERVDALNTYPRALGPSTLFGPRDRGNGAWMLFEPVWGRPTFVELRPFRNLVFIGYAPVLFDFRAKVWTIVSRIMDEQASAGAPRI